MICTTQQSAYTVGRANTAHQASRAVPACDFNVEVKSMSRVHAQLYLSAEGTQLALEDRRSKFGSCIKKNGSEGFRRVEPSHPCSLNDGDEVKLGTSLWLVRRHIGRRPILIDLPVEMLPVALHGLSEGTVFRTVPQVCKALHEALCSPAFMRARAELARAAVSWSKLVGVAYRDEMLLHSLRPFLPHATSLYSYVQQTRAIDWSGGSEQCILTLDTRLRVGSTELLSEMPKACIELHGNTGKFIYDAGPWPSPWLLQIFRAGAPGKFAGKHYGIRTLQDIPQGAFVCAYWGETRAMTGSDQPGRLPCSRYGLRVTTLTPESTTEGHCASRFVVDPARRGNLARWINFSHHSPNLMPSLESVPGAKFKLVVLRASIPIAAGMELLWDYGEEFNYESEADDFGDNNEGIVPKMRHDGPPVVYRKDMGWIHLARHRVDEMVRKYDGKPLAAAWAANMTKHSISNDHSDDSDDSDDYGDVLLVQSLPPNQASSPEEHRFHETNRVSHSNSYVSAAPLLTYGEWLQQLPALPKSKSEFRVLPLAGWKGEWWGEYTCLGAGSF
mmetsp:Transcript_4240/g.9322  ORF Transcript_4240/g.9322 Transcript_4240/m.9322 type:complete len:558 (+) Transcript_4240:329-2002(+)